MDQASAIARGQLTKVYLCADCVATLDQAEQEIEAARVELITAFEVRRAEILSALRRTLKRLPDE